MGRRYSTELAELTTTYQRVRQLSPVRALPLRRLLRQLSEQSVAFVGSGGTLALAALAADEHTARTGSLARCLTPLQLAAIPDLDAATVVFSARARHPDVLAAARSARSSGSYPVVLVTQLPVEDLRPQVANAFDLCVSVASASKDGFLATNSVLATAAAWLAAGGHALPEQLPLVETSLPALDMTPSRVLALYDPWCRAAATDLEARLSETGLSEVQLADLRNVAHGRHVGFSRRAGDTLVIPIFGPDGRDLAMRTLAVLPTETQPLSIASSLPFPITNLDCLVGSMRLVGALADRSGEDPGRPHVSSAGRRLYHLPWQVVAPGPRPRRQSPAVARKLAAAHALGDARSALRRIYADALGNWLVTCRTTALQGILLDYDGTCCETDQRLEPPPQNVREHIIRLLQQGLEVGFASGRGKSLPIAAREWIPKHLWHRVVVGLYNGAVLVRLNEEVPDQRTCNDPALLEVASQLERIGRTLDWTVECRAQQVTVTARHDVHALRTARSVVEAVVIRPEGRGLRLLSSGHSIDIIRGSTTKTTVFDSMSLSGNDEVLAIGDQGDPDGNDFELLAYRNFTLSVDRVSADSDRCWNLGDPTQSATEILGDYLSSIRVDAQGLGYFEWPLQLVAQDDTGVLAPSPKPPYGKAP